mmetsp:Transcript_14227/g.24319  ORF Transcript_14227/g.24319 Transcript_14227/m.24319 type:complete len:338 (-) Transcript_14227:134-1147(-)|eukprot:CAMPEP_0183770798 /NCGR_PEP_ID=MMETSP0739-20130205/30055_1 /TAXON_ID=385413 /ORGANISM="Thalassiosira miniscula, Strain CCMP1093" /LENGTH=337 /DNA_ID=CAMNT_0026010945 /DNA_START=83 /DNA_END=1096 /DNA_ORIENTATION=-
MRVSIASIASNASNDFNVLRQDYECAIDCLMQCESLINSLQDQLTSKDKQIKVLEGKLVEMSLELASSKAREDEHELQFKQMASQDSSQCADDSEKTTNNGHIIIKGRRPIRRSLPASLEPKIQPQENRPIFSRSQSDYRIFSMQSDYATISNCKAAETKEENTLRNNNNDINNQDPSCSQQQLLDDSHNSSSTASTPTSSRLSNLLGQYLHLHLQSSRRNSNNDESAATAAEDDTTTLKRTIEREIDQNFRGGGDLRRNHDDDGDLLSSWRQSRQRRTLLQSSSGSIISGVVFPVSSDDCLLGLGESHSSRRSRRGGSLRQQSRSLNEEWPSSLFD